jgi:hypothetical protein
MPPSFDEGRGHYLGIAPNEGGYRFILESAYGDRLYLSSHFLSFNECECSARECYPEATFLGEAYDGIEVRPAPDRKRPNALRTRARR